MNSKEIKKKYPKAMELCIKWLQENGYMTTINNWVYDERDLYGFFDDNGIVSEIKYFGIKDETIDIENENWYGFHWQIYNTELEMLNESKEYEGGNTRSEAESQLFTKCFEILENKLK